MVKYQRDRQPAAHSNIDIMIPPVRLNGSPKPAIIESPQNKIERGESHGQDMEYLVLAN